MTRLAARSLSALALAASLSTSCAKPDQAAAAWVEIEVASATEALPLPDAVTVVLDPGDATASASLNAPARFSSVKPNASFTARASGSFLGDPVQVSTNASGQGKARLTLIPLEPSDPNPIPSAYLELDLTKEITTLRWQTDAATTCTFDYAEGRAMETSLLRVALEDCGGARAESGALAHIAIGKETAQKRILEAANAIQGLKQDRAEDGGALRAFPFRIAVGMGSFAAKQRGGPSDIDETPMRPLAPDDIDLAKTTAAASNALGVDVYRALRSADANLNLSPPSLYMTLAMAHAGAAGSTRAQLAKLLRVPANAEQYQSALRAFGESLHNATPSGSYGRARRQENLRMANGLWVQQGAPLSPTYTTLLEKDFSAPPHTVDFSGAPEAAAREINDWVEKSTGNLIKNMLSPGAIQPSMRMILSNAVYFKGLWQEPFSERDTKPETFHLANGKTTQVPMMHKHIRALYTKGSGWQAVRLLYRSGAYSMVLVLPDEGKRATIEPKLNEILQKAREGSPRHTVRLALPKATFSWGASMLAPLRKLGATDPWDAAKADYSGMAAAKDIFIGELLQGTYIRIDEHGTEAAGATMGQGFGTGHSETVDLVFDRPFPFAIVDERTGMYVFLGQVALPG